MGSDKTRFDADNEESFDIDAARAGECTARLRNQHDLSRGKLAVRISNVLGEDHPDFDRYNETWLKRFEAGKVKKVSRLTLDIIARALRCTPYERSQLFLAAGRSVIAEAGGAPEVEEELINYACQELCARTAVRVVVKKLLGQRRASELGDAERFEIIQQAIGAMLVHLTGRSTHDA
jgi:hypothetical protein